MKLSNKILIGFFGFIFLYLTAVFAEVRFRGNLAVIDDSNSRAETVDISGVTHLILADLGKSINVIGSDQPRLEVRSISGDLLKKLKYNISGDTLTLSQLDLEKNMNIRISVYVPQNSFIGMTVNGASVKLEGLEQKVLSVFQNSGRISMDITNKVEKLYIEANNRANFYVSGTDLDTLSTLLDNSEVTIDSRVTLLKGSIKNNSYVRIGGTEEIQFKKDESSRLYLY